MREIKFRAWHKPTQLMGDVVLIDIYNEKIGILYADPVMQCESIQKYNFNEVELMQYTCLKDKNGKEIYEGDIVTFLGIRWDGPDGDRVEYVGIVRYSDEHTSFNFEISNGMQATTFEADDIKIIGNIHDNPELMGEKK